MSSTLYQDFSLPAINAAWLNDVNNSIYDTPNSVGVQPGTIRASLSNTATPTLGDALIGMRRTDIASATGLTLHDWFQRDRVNVRQVGVQGDGTTDDAPLLNILGALGIPLYFPYTSTGYKINSTVSFNCDIYCDGFFIPATTIGSAAQDYNRFAIVLQSAGFGVGRRFHGIKIQGSGPLRAANVSGVRNDCEDSVCTAFKIGPLNYGIVARSYSQKYMYCSAQLCNVNVAAYARSTSLEINALEIFGGTYDSGVVASCIIGDTSWSDAMAAGTNAHGVVINIGGGVSFDGNEVRIDNVYCVKISGYFEGSSTGTAIRLGGSGDGNLRDVEVGKCYFASLQYAVKCFSAVQGLVVQPSFYTAVTRCALYLNSDLYPFAYNRGTFVGSFTQGQEIHTGFRSLPLTSITWSNASIDYQNLIRGSQNVTYSTGIWYGGGVKQLASGITRMNASTAGRFYDAPATTKAGTVSGGTTFTFTTLADTYLFNGGDRIVTSPAGSNYVRSVDYAAGTMLLDTAIANGAATVSQQLATFA